MATSRVALKNGKRSGRFFSLERKLLHLVSFTSVRGRRLDCSLIYSDFTSPSSQSQTKESIFDTEKEEFRKCFKSVLDGSNSETSLEKKVDQAFVLWWAKWHAKQDALQQTQQRPSRLQDNSGFQAADSPEPKGAFDPPMQFPDTSSPQERSEVANNASFSHSQPQYPTPEGRWGTVPARRRVASAPSPGPRFEDLAFPSQSQGPVAPYFGQPQEQHTMYQPVYHNPNMTSGNGAQQNPQPSNPLGLAIRGHHAPFGEYDGPHQTNDSPANPFQNNITDFPMTEAPQTQPIYSAAQAPQYFAQYFPQQLPSHPALQPLGQTQFSGPAHNQVFPPQSIESQQGTFNYPNQNLPGSNLQNSARFYDPNARENQYES